MCSPYMAKACPVIHSQGTLQRMQALGGIQITSAELWTGKTANGPFFSFVKCTSHEVRGKVPSGLIPTHYHHLQSSRNVSTEKKLNSLIEPSSSYVHQRVSEVGKWPQLSLFPMDFQTWYCREAKHSEIDCDYSLNPASVLLMAH